MPPHMKARRAACLTKAPAPAILSRPALQTQFPSRISQRNHKRKPQRDHYTKKSQEIFFLCLGVLVAKEKRAIIVRPRKTVRNGRGGVQTRPYRTPPRPCSHNPTHRRARRPNRPNGEENHQGAKTQTAHRTTSSRVTGWFAFCSCLCLVSGQVLRHWYRATQRSSKSLINRGNVRQQGARRPAAGAWRIQDIRALRILVQIIRGQRSSRRRVHGSIGIESLESPRIDRAGEQKGQNRQ